MANKAATGAVNVAREVAALQQMTVKQLREKYADSWVASFLTPSELGKSRAEGKLSNFLPCDSLGYPNTS